jgi:hypothetical protein
VNSFILHSDCFLKVLAIVAGVPIVHPRFAAAVLDRPQLCDPLPDPKHFALPSELPAALEPSHNQVRRTPQ